MIGYARMMLHRLSNSACHARMREHLALERLPHDELRQRQFWVAVTLLKHAYETVPHYRALMDGAGLHPDTVRSFADFAALPVLRRWPAGAPAPDLVSKALPRKALAALQGQSAENGGCLPAPILRDRAARDETQANWLLCLTFAGWTQADMVVRLYAASGDESGDLLHPGVREWLAGTLAVDGCTYAPDAVAQWVKAIRRCGRAYVLGNARVMADMADFMREGGIRLGNVRGAVVSGGRGDHHPYANGLPDAGGLHIGVPGQPGQTGQTGQTGHAVHTGPADGDGTGRQRIAEAFGCPVFDLYGCAEVPCIAMQCGAGNLHLLTHSAHVAFEPDAACGPPRLIVTDLNNRAMPVLRFDTGDHGVPVDGPCPCGRGFPLMRRVPATGTWFQTVEGRFIPGDAFARGLAARLDALLALVPGESAAGGHPDGGAAQHGDGDGEGGGNGSDNRGAGHQAGHETAHGGSHQMGPHMGRGDSRHPAHRGGRGAYRAWPAFRQVVPGVVHVVLPAECAMGATPFGALVRDTVREVVRDAAQGAGVADASALATLTFVQATTPAGRDASHGGGPPQGGHRP